MQQSNSPKTIHQTRGSAKRLASAILTAGLILSMSVHTFASVAVNGRSVQPSAHRDNTAHLPDATPFPKEERQLAKQSPIADYMYAGTIRIKEGESLELHIRQGGVALFGIDGYAPLQWYSVNGDDYTTVLDISSSLDGLDKSKYLAHMKAYKAANDSSGHSTAYCEELTLTGKKAGIAYVAYQDATGLAGHYYRVVVTKA